MGILLFFMGVKYGIGWVKENAYLRVAKVFAMLVLAVGVVAIMVAQPLRVTGEYTPYSIRGGTGEKGSTGVHFAYATNWSFAPEEMFTFLMPRFFGGTSNERYTGNAVPEFRGKRIPGYWGSMPFSGNTEYLGVVAIILAAIGFYALRKQGVVWALVLLIVFSLFLSFGRHFPAFYRLFFQYMPVFNKFRAPVMILVLVMFSICVMAAYGLDALMQVEKTRRQELQRVVLWIFGILFLVSLVPFLLKGAFSFERPGEAGEYGRAMEYIRVARYEMMRGSALRLMLFTLLVCGLIWGYLRRFWPQKSLLAAGVVVLLLIDLLSVGNWLFDKDKLLIVEDLERTRFSLSDTDRFLLQDEENFRIFPVGELFDSNDWSYYHQSISGYDPAKLRIVQDIIESCLYRGWDPNVPINWNVVDMLNAKYVIAKGAISSSHLQQVFTDKRKQYFVYRNLTVLPRTFFVGHYEVIPERKDRLVRLNDKAFDPGKTAILEFDPRLNIAAPDSNAMANIALFEPDRIALHVQNRHNSLMVLSEVYYPKGWRAYVDGEETEVFKTNHLLRSIFVPGGAHDIEFRFRPTSYFRNAKISQYSTYILYLLLLMDLGIRFARKRKHDAQGTV